MSDYVCINCGQRYFYADGEPCVCGGAVLEDRDPEEDR